MRKVMRKRGKFNSCDDRWGIRFFMIPSKQNIRKKKL